MILALVLLVAVAAGLALGGSLRELAGLRLRAAWLILLALALQVAAFPSGLLPWETPDSAAVVLWLGSYALLLAAVAVNRRVRGLMVVAAGMGSNVLAIVANGGHMPALPSAAADAGLAPGIDNNSQTVAEPTLALLVDRWAAPDWVPLANVYSAGDVLLALGAFAVVLPAMGALGRHREQTAAPGGDPLPRQA